MGFTKGCFTMKKLVCFLLLFAMIFTVSACSSKDGNGETEKETLPALSQDEIDSYIGDGTLSIIRSEITVAADFCANCVYYGNPETDKKAVKDDNGKAYYPVKGLAFSSYEELREYLKSFFTDDVTEAILKNGKFKDIDGKLCCDTSAVKDGESPIPADCEIDSYKKDGESLSLTLKNSDGKKATVKLISVDGEYKINQELK